MEHKTSQLYIVSDFQLIPTIFLPYFSPGTSMCLSVSSCLSLPSEASKCQTRFSSIVHKMPEFTCSAADYLRLIQYIQNAVKIMVWVYSVSQNNSQFVVQNIQVNLIFSYKSISKFEETSTECKITIFIF